MVRIDWRLSFVAAAILISGCGGGGGSGGGNAPPASPFSVANPFALSTATSVEDVRIDDLRIFGDSYSVASWQGTKSWSTVLRENNTTAKVATYAISGAKAAVGENSAFGRQIDTWQASGSAIANRDLTVAYFGYNDVGGDLAAARNGFQAGVDRLVAQGAASSGRRLFVTQIHDWSRNPSVSPALAQDVRDWNSFVTGVANGNSGIVAVDLFTVFERIFQNPGAFGFNNVTTVDRNNSDSTALFFDGFHFGDRGQDIIARVYRHYLTRGWDWANSIAAGSSAAARLNQDLDNGRLVLGLTEAGGTASGRTLGLTAVPIGRPAIASELDNALGTAVLLDPVRASFTEAKAGPIAAGGVALDYRLDPKTSFGLGIARYDGSTIADRGLAGVRQDHASDALTFYWQRALSGFVATTRFAYLDHEMTERSADDLLGQSGISRHDGSTWSLDQRLTGPTRVGPATLTPWASLAYEHHDLAPYTAKGLYTSDLHYSGASVTDVTGAIGLDVQTDAIPLAASRQLWLSGGVALTTSLHRDDAELRVTEVAQPGLIQHENIEREGFERFDLSLNAVLGVTEALHLRGGYALSADSGDRAQQVRFGLDYRF